jgi:hypothetical protein
MAFVRGGEVKEILGIGRDAILKEIGGVVINDKGQIERWKTEDKWDATGLLSGLEDLEKEENELAENNFRKKNVIIGVADGKFSILRNRIQYHGPFDGDEKDLIIVLLDLRDCFRKWGINNVFFPFAKKVAATTIGLDLVSVQPLSAPTGHIAWFDYEYGKKTLAKRIKKFFKNQYWFFKVKTRKIYYKYLDKYINKNNLKSSKVFY